MNILYSIKRAFGFKVENRINEFREIYLKAYKAYEYRDDFIRMLQQLYFEPTTKFFTRIDNNTVVYMIHKKKDVLLLFIPKSYSDEVAKFAEMHDVKVIMGVDHA